MNGEANALSRLVEAIFIGESEVQCKEAGILMARCAHALLSDEESRQQYPALWHHFRLCPDCAEEYRLLIELAQLQADGQLDQPTHIPPPPEKRRSTGWTQAADAIKAAFPGFAPALAGALMRGTDLGIEPIDVILAESKLRISFDVTSSEQDPGRRNLFCTVSTGDETLRAAREGSPVWLQIGDEKPVVLEEALNELGDAAFTRLLPGRYALRLYLAGEEYIITGILLP